MPSRPLLPEHVVVDIERCRRGEVLATADAIEALRRTLNQILDELLILSASIAATTTGPTGAKGATGATGGDGGVDLLELHRYAFRRLDFLEQALGIAYSKRDIVVPEQLTLLEE